MSIKKKLGIAWLTFVSFGGLSILIYFAINGDEGPKTALALLGLGLFVTLTFFSIEALTSN